MQVLPYCEGNQTISSLPMCLLGFFKLPILEFLYTFELQGLTEKFKEKDTSYSGSATFSYESFMLTVLPFLIA